MSLMVIEHVRYSGNIISHLVKFRECPSHLSLLKLFDRKPYEKRPTYNATNLSFPVNIY